LPKVAPFKIIAAGARLQFAVKVSAEDYDWLMQWKWTYARSHGQWSGLIYARRSERQGDGNVTILMHREILIRRMGIERPSDKYFVDHWNEDSRDNRREGDDGHAQLSWMTAKENAAKRTGRGRFITPILPPESGLMEPGEEIPY
jgi:hypothetical protein